jgi:gamma-aminobutyric acid receptor subunit beta
MSCNVLSKRNFLSVILLFATTVVNAQTATHNADRTATRPNAAGAPEQITLRLGLLDIVEIDDREQVFTADLFIEVGWQDPRLALDDGAVTDLRTVALEEIWNPRLTVVNSRGLEVLLPQVATVDGRGNVVVRQRLAGSLAVDLDLRKFPFDTQRLPIEIVSYQYSPDEIVFSGDSEMVARVDRLSGDGWVYGEIEPERFVYRLEDGSRGVAGLAFRVSAERESEYFVLTLALPMTLILFLAWMVHWLPVDVIPARMGTASATVFSLIAFGVSFRLTLPKITYLTDADRFVLYSTVLVLASLAITVIGIRLVGAEKKDAAERLARQTRLAFPVLFGLIVLRILAG